MISWLVRGLLIAGGSVASWFMTRDSPQFGLIQMAVTILLVIFIVAVLAFWPTRWTHLLDRFHKGR